MHEGHDGDMNNRRERGAYEGSKGGEKLKADLGQAATRVPGHPASGKTGWLGEAVVKYYTT
jgi:hypothetical protein